jgi:hypothetical protein
MSPQSKGGVFVVSAWLEGSAGRDFRARIHYVIDTLKPDEVSLAAANTEQVNAALQSWLAKFLATEHLEDGNSSTQL